MSNIEKIKAEIERRIKAYKTKNGFPAGTICAIRIETYEGLLSFIDSLPEEKPSEDLNDEIKKFIEEYGYERGEDKLLIAIVARHFAEWQKEQMMKDAVEGFVATHLTSEGTKVTVNSGYLPKEMCIKPGDKVRIIIVKED